MIPSTDCETVGSCYVVFIINVQDLYATFTKTKIFIEHFRFGL